jgi:hypothetical protein
MRETLAEIAELRRLAQGCRGADRRELQDIYRRLLRVREETKHWPGSAKLLSLIDLALHEAEELIARAEPAPMPR